MSCLHYDNNELFIENVCLKKIAEEFGTPTYVYSQAAIKKNWYAFDQALAGIPHRICYAVKANSNLAILNLLAELRSGFDIVSLGELERVLLAGGDPKKIIFSGVGKTKHEIEFAINKGIYCFNVESKAELERLAEIATQQNKQINIALRINPDIDAKTHHYISTGLKENKFGIETSQIMSLAHELLELPAVKLIGVACHIGSQITELNPFLQALDKLIEIYKEFTKLGINIEHINIGGGLGIAYKDEQPPTISDYVTALRKKLKNIPIEIIIEPGRAIVGNAGILLTRVEYIKESHHKNFAIVDAGMNDLLRPALYHAWQDILPLQLRNEAKKTYDIAGPVCESADFLGKNRSLAIKSGDYLAVDSVGAYGFSMSSNYNSRCRPAEILIDDDIVRIIRRRETSEELLVFEKNRDLKLFY